MINRENLKDLCPLTPMQEGMLYHDQLDSQSTAYHEKITFFLSGHLDATCYRQAWQQLVERHDILRSVFVVNKTQRPLQAVLKRVEAEFRVEDYSQWLASFDDRQEQQQHLLEKIYSADEQQGFQLTRQVPLRLSLYKMADQRWCLFWSFHHILLDGWSVNLLMQEMGQIYAALLAKKAPALPPVLPFKHYLQWIEKQQQSTGREFWQTYLEAYDTGISLPSCGVEQGASFPPINETAHQAAQKITPIDSHLSQAIENFAQQQQVTVNAIVQAAWGILLARYNDCRDVLFASVVSGRPSEILGVESMVGLFINTVPVRVQFSHQETLTALLQRLHQHNSESQAFQFLPMADIQPRQAAPDHLVVFENYFSGDDSQENGDTVNEQDIERLNIDGVKVREQTNYDFTLVLAPGKQWQLTCLYHTSRYGEEYINQVMKHFIHLLKVMTQADSETYIRDLDILDTKEQQQLLKWSGDSVPYPDSMSLAEAFEQIVERHREKIALNDAEQQYSYAELNQCANRLANHLIQQGVRPGQMVAIHLPRNCQRIISVLAVIKAGAAYLGIEMDTPMARLTSLCLDADARVIMTEKNGEQLPEGISIIAPNVVIAQAPETANPKVYVNANSFAYISYTSGSTGKPKGVCVTQKNVMRLVKNNTFINLQRDDRFLQLAPLSFDASTLEIWAPLLNGARLTVLAQEKPGLEQIAHYLREQQITCLWLTAGLFHQMVDNCLESLASIRQLLAGGDVISPEHVKRLLDVYPQMVFINGYGPTENTTFSCCSRSDVTPPMTKTVPIGSVIKNSQAFVLDQLLRLQPIGASGELYVGGDGVSLGYWGQAAQTAAVFVPHPFSQQGAHDQGRRLYRTGDRVNFMAENVIAFQGRVDQQFKIRGYRIEAQEVENSLKKLPQVRDAVVKVVGDKQSDKVLVAYINSAASELDESHLKQQLAQQLPHYLIPDFFIKMDGFPLNANGKIDRDELPSPFLQQQKKDRVAPSNATEQQLYEIWKQILSIETFGVEDDFFQLGGHSLKATQVVSLIKKQMNRELPLRMVFELPTIKAMAAKLSQMEQPDEKGPVLKRAERRGRKVVTQS